MADYTQLMNLEKKKKEQPTPSHAQKDASIQSVDQLTDQLANQLTDQSTSQPTAFTVNKTVERPKSFYITLRLDKRLDDAVRYFQEKHGIKKVDRSILINALLDTDAVWTHEALDMLVERIIRILTNKIMR